MKVRSLLLAVLFMVGVSSLASAQPRETWVNANTDPVVTTCNGTGGNDTSAALTAGLYAVAVTAGTIYINPVLTSGAADQSDWPITGESSPQEFFIDGANVDRITCITEVGQTKTMFLQLRKPLTR